MILARPIRGRAGDDIPAGATAPLGADAATTVQPRSTISPWPILAGPAGCLPRIKPTRTSRDPEGSASESPIAGRSSSTRLRRRASSRVSTTEPDLTAIEDLVLSVSLSLDRSIPTPKFEYSSPRRDRASRMLTDAPLGNSPHSTSRSRRHERRHGRATNHDGRGRLAGSGSMRSRSGRNLGHKRVDRAKPDQPETLARDGARS